jgi:GNAT superfamily N-acetyltransferase
MHMDRARRTTRSTALPVALVGLAVALPLGLVGAAGDTGAVARSCEAFVVREHRTVGLGQSLAAAARQFCGHQHAPAAAIGTTPAPLLPLAQPTGLVLAEAATPPLPMRLPLALLNLPPPA